MPSTQPLEETKEKVEQYLDSLPKCTTHASFIVLSMSVVWGVTAFPIMAPAFTSESSNLTYFRTLWDDFDLDKNVLLRSPELDIVIFFMASMIFGNFGPILADRFGRRPIVIATVFVMGLACIGSALSPNYIVYLLFRFIQGICYSGVTVVNWILVSESLAPARHGVAALLFGIGWTLGYILIAPLSLLWPTWRGLFFMYGIPITLYAGLLYWKLPESLCFLTIHNRRKAVRKWMKKAAGRKREEESEDILFPSEKSSTTVASTDSDTEKSYHDDDSSRREEEGEEEKSVVQLFRELLSRKRILLWLIILTVIWIADMLIYNAVSISSTALAVGDPTWNFALGGLMELPAYLTLPLFMYWFGIKHTVIAIHAISGAFLLGLFFIPPEQETFYLIVWCVVKFCCSCMDISHIVYSSSIFPPELRGICMGTCATAKNIGLIIAPYSSRLNDLYPFLAYAVFGVTSFFTAAIAFPLPNPGRLKSKFGGH